MNANINEQVNANTNANTKQNNWLYSYFKGDTDVLITLSYKHLTMLENKYITNLNDNNIEEYLSMVYIHDVLKYCINTYEEVDLELEINDDNSSILAEDYSENLLIELSVYIVEKTVNEIKTIYITFVNEVSYHTFIMDTSDELCEILFGYNGDVTDINAIECFDRGNVMIYMTSNNNHLRQGIKDEIVIDYPFKNANKLY